MLYAPNWRSLEQIILLSVIILNMDQSYFRQGLKNGLPIGIGYFAVAFSLVVFAGNVGIKPIQGLIASLLTNASAG